MIIFHFNDYNVEKHILKVNLNTFFKNASTSTICPILQNELQVDEILIYIKFQVNEDLKDTYVLSNYAFYNHNISNFQCKVSLNTVLTNHFQTYFWYTFIIPKLFNLLM
jgi:hypothetical protein